MPPTQLPYSRDQVRAKVGVEARIQVRVKARVQDMVEARVRCPRHHCLMMRILMSPHGWAACHLQMVWTGVRARMHGWAVYHLNELLVLVVFHAWVDRVCIWVVAITAPVGTANLVDEVVL